MPLEASVLDIVIVVGGTIAFWKLIGRPFCEWCSSVTGIEFIRRKK